MQFRGSRPYELTETAYLEFRRRARCEGWTLLHSLQSATTPSASDPTAAEELRNHWLPLRRWLTARQQDFAADLVPPPAPSQPPIARSAEQITADLQQARQLSQSGDWLLALECWSRLVPHLSADLRREALQERTRALEQLQEPYLVERELRGMFCFDPDPQVRAMAAAYLRQRYEREADLYGLETLAATELLREPTAARLGEVARVLLQAGEWSLALMAGSELLPEMPPDDLLLAASQLGWWQVFEELRRGLPAGPAQHYWFAVRCLAQGQTEQADQHLGQAGTAGSTLRRHLQWGRQILPQLKDPDRSVRLEGIVAWENWQVQYPGPWSWQPDRAAVIQCAGAASVYLVERDRYLQYYRAQPDQPVWLELQGPVMLQLEARPLHNQGEDQALHDELMVRGAGREHLFPINNNRAATGLEIVEHPTQVPGYRCGGTLALGPGRHRLQVSAGRTQVLVRARLRQPVGLLPVLPPLTCQTVQAVWDGSYGTTVAVHPDGALQDPAHLARPAPQLLLSDGRLQSLPLVRPSEPIGAPAHVTVFTPLQMARVEFPSRNDPAPAPAAVADVGHARPPSDDRRRAEGTADPVCGRSSSVARFRAVAHDALGRTGGVDPPWSDGSSGGGRSGR